jgi:hypothetical protein
MRGYDNVVRLVLDDENFDARGDSGKYYPVGIDMAVGEPSGRSQGAPSS